MPHESGLNTSATVRYVRWLFLSNAIINWIVSLPGLISPSAAAAIFGGLDPNYPSVIRLWQGFVFMFGWMFWEVSRDVRGKAALIKYNWIEKTITASVITLGFLHGDIPTRLMGLIVLTKWLWIPFIIWAHLAVRREAEAQTAFTSGQPG
ncbi:MAG: hypothetical protein HYV95_01870 [Opitutae bacterium]|nr:hypothetical protein [Opitutae bacterium]